MRYVVTGGAGFIGSHVAEGLLAQGDQILVIDDLSRGRRENLPSGVDFEERSVLDQGLAEVLGAFEPDGVVHLAAQIDVRRSVEDPAFDARTNVVGTLLTAEAALKAGVKVFVFASTGGAIYGEQELFPAPESHPCRPVSPYGTSKQCGEHYIDYFSRTGAMRAVHLRYANVYGPRQDPHGEAGVVAIFSGKMLAGETPFINGDGKQTRDYVYVGDVARANRLALRAPEAHGPINIATGVETDVVTLSRQIAEAAGYGGPIDHAPAQPGEQRRSVLANGHAATVLGWHPEVTFAEGIRQTVDWFRDR